MRRLRVFVVDDDPEFAEGLALALEIAGHDVERASSGQEALDRLAHQDFDVTLLDFRMPGMDGVECYLKIRELRREAKVIMMTAYRNQDRLQQAIAAGALQVLSKPISNETLFDTFKSASLYGDILLVDDDPDFAEGLESTLAQEGYSVAVARTASEAVDLASRNDFDVMILDLRLPGSSGLDVYVKLRDLSRELPTMIVTGFAEEEANAIDRLKAMAVDDCLTKPVRTDELLQAVERLTAETR